MRVIPLAAISNQRFSCLIGGRRFALTFKQITDVLCVDIVIDGIRVLSGSRVLAGEVLIPYRYLESGNFLVLTLGGEIPNWQSLGRTQTLVYLTRDEILEIPQITMSDILAQEPVPGYLYTDDGLYILTDDNQLIEAD